MVTIDDILSASKLLRGIVHKTPLLTSRTFDLNSGNSVFLKAENLQRIGAFKIRGAFNKIHSLSKEERQRGVVAHSSGNHAQGVALAARILGAKATVVMPKGSLANKIAATRSYGAAVEFSEDSSDDRERVAKRIQQESGYVLIPPFDDDKIIAGQGTVMVEIAEELRELDYLFVPIGGGGLIAGCAVAAKHFFPNIKVIGVETEAANDAQQSFWKRERVRIDPPKTIADGMRTQSVGQRNFEIILSTVDEVVTVADSQVIDMVRFFLERMKTIVEPTGAVAPAAVYFNAMGLKGKKVCAVISGGNADPAFLKSILPDRS